MTYQGDFTLPTELLEQIATNGFDQLPELIRCGGQCRHASGAPAISRSRTLPTYP